jgi:hypothetical protein
MKNLNIKRMMILMWFWLMIAAPAVSQITNDEELREKARISEKLSIRHNQQGNIEDAITKCNKAVEFLNSVNEMQKSDFVNLGIIYTNLAIYADYLDSNDEVIKNLISAYNSFSKVAEPKNFDDKNNQTGILKTLLFHLLHQNKHEDEGFDKYISSFTEQIETLKGDRIQYIGYQKYLQSIRRIEAEGFSNFDVILFDSERYSVQNQIMLNEKLKYVSEKRYLKSLRELIELSPRNEQVTLNTHLVILLGNLSYRSLFQSEFEFSEKCAKEGLGLKMNQWWIATNLVHSLYIQGKLDESREIYYRYRNIKHTDGNTLRQIIKTDIKELQMKGVCDSTYYQFINNIDEEMAIKFSTNTSPRIPVLCKEKGGVVTSSTLDSKSYIWKHLESDKEKKGKTVLLDQQGLWTLTTFNNELRGEAIDTVYVDRSEKLYYTDAFLRQSNFLPIPIFRDYDATSNKFTNARIAFVQKSPEFASIDSVANIILKDFKPIKDLGGSSIIISNQDFCSDTFEANYDSFNQLSAGLFIILSFVSNENRGIMYIKGKDNYEEYPIMDERPKYNQHFHLQNLLPEIIEANGSSSEIARVILSNIFMGHPTGGYR